jgi:hypothetical protein
MLRADRDTSVHVRPQRPSGRVHTPRRPEQNGSGKRPDFSTGTQSSSNDAAEDVMAKQLPYLPANSTLITLYARTNDSRAVKDPTQTVEKVTNIYGKHFNDLLSAIHAKAPKARVVPLSERAIPRSRI